VCPYTETCCMLHLQQLSSGLANSLATAWSVGLLMVDCGGFCSAQSHTKHIATAWVMDWTLDTVVLLVCQHLHCFLRCKGFAWTFDHVNGMRSDCMSSQDGHEQFMPTSSCR
jgi:hypothetical protein